MVFEHITTSDAVDFGAGGWGRRSPPPSTPQHLHINRNAMLVGGIQPHNYCLPVAKRRDAPAGRVRAGGDQWQRSNFFLGTDSAPHLRRDKESACECAGIFGAPFALESYITVFNEKGGARCVRGVCLAPRSGLLQAAGQRKGKENPVTLERGRELSVPPMLHVTGEEIVPFHGGGNAGMALRRLGSAAAPPPLCQQVVDKDRHGDPDQHK